jgi:transcriptional regulator with XRE-family HTH domain
MDLKWLKQMLERPGYSQAGLARALKRDPAAVSRMLKDEREIKSRDLAVIESYLGVSVPRNGEFRSKIGGKAPPIDVDYDLPKLVLYRTIPMRRGERDGFMLYAQKAGETIRPSSLAFSQNAFSIKVLDEKLEPVYRRRDTLLIDPDYHIIIGEDCLFAAEGWESGGFSVIARLLERTEDLWKCRSLSTGELFELQRAEFKHAWPIMDRYRPR